MIDYKYIPEENIKQYIPITSDTVKEGFNVKNFKEDPIPFFISTNNSNKKPAKIVSFVVNKTQIWLIGLKPKNSSL